MAATRFVNLVVNTDQNPEIFILNSDSTQQVAYWSKVAVSIPSVKNPPWPLLLLPLDQNNTTTYNVIVPQQDGTYRGCSISFMPDGSLPNSPAPNACPGLVQIHSNNPKPSNVTSYAFPATFGIPITIKDPGVLKKQLAPNAIPRKLRVKNNTAYDVCMVNQKNNPNSHPNPDQMCKGAFQILVKSQDTYDYNIPISGLDSAAWIIAGYRKPDEAWQSTGFVDESQAATKIEITMYPYRLDDSGAIVSSVGPTNIDVSSVDGANLLYDFYPVHPTDSGVTSICYQNMLSDSYIGEFSVDNPISRFNDADHTGNFTCTDDALYNCGCASPCTMAHHNNEQQEAINQKCCINDYGTRDTCLNNNPYDPLKTLYFSMVRKQFDNSYSFAYDDDKADFTCDALASYELNINGVGPDIVRSTKSVLRK